jgi:hypothetical protein
VAIKNSLVSQLEISPRNKLVHPHTHTICLFDFLSLWISIVTLTNLVFLFYYFEKLTKTKNIKMLTLHGFPRIKIRCLNSKKLTQQRLYRLLFPPFPQSRFAGLSLIGPTLFASSFFFLRVNTLVVKKLFEMRQK